LQTYTCSPKKWMTEVCEVHIRLQAMNTTLQVAQLWRRAQRRRQLPLLARSPRTACVWTITALQSTRLDINRVTFYSSGHKGLQRAFEKYMICTRREEESSVPTIDSSITVVCSLAHPPSAISLSVDLVTWVNWGAKM
jgi:hypothetical protein